MVIQFILLYGRATPGRLLFGLVIMCVVAVYQTYFSTKARIAKAIKKATVTRIAEVKSGQVVKVKGAITIAGRTVAAGLSGRECVYYEIVVEEKGRHSWMTLIEERKRGDVVLYDGSGYAMIRDHKAQTLFVPDVLYTSGTFDDALPEMEAFLNKHRMKSQDWLGLNKQLRYTEGILEEGELCVAVGKAVWMKTSAVGVKINADKILVINAAPDVKCYISDDPEVMDAV
jgi:hypothetical protein